MPIGLEPRQVELMALTAAQALFDGATEDARVEFKSCLLADPRKAARRIAGHANAARSEPILWLVGLGEDREFSVDHFPEQQDPASYWPQVWKWFDGPHPELVDVHVEFQGHHLLALGFECDRTPYVIRTGKDEPTLEVPWREGTRVCTATRSQLILSLLPTARAPIVEVRDVFGAPSYLEVILFVIPPTPDLVCLPRDRCICSWGPDAYTAVSLELSRERPLKGGHPAVKRAPEGLYFNGPGPAVAKWEIKTASPPRPCSLHLRFEPGGLDGVIRDGIPSR
jgi:hypothetical protein